MAPIAIVRGIISGDCDYSVIFLMTRHGLLAQNTPSGMSLVTTLPAPTTVFEPIVTPGQMMAPPPIQTSTPISIGLPNSCLRRSRHSSDGWRCKSEPQVRRG